MINSLSNIFSEYGLLKKSKGVTLNRKEILCVDKDISPELLRLYVNLTSRLGVEISGFEPPLSGEKYEDAIRLTMRADVPAGTCVLTLSEGGIQLSASSISDMDRGVEFLTTIYPFDDNGRDLRDIENINQIKINCESLSVSDFSCLDAESHGKDCRDLTKESTLGNCNSYQRAKKHYIQNTDFRIFTENIQEWEPESVLAASLRCAMENYETVYPYSMTEKVALYRYIRFENSESVSMVKKEGNDIIFVGSRDNMTNIVYAFSKAEEDPFKEELITCIEDILACKNEIGQAALAVAEHSDTFGNNSRLITKEYAAGVVDRVALERYLSGNSKEVVVSNFNDGREVFRTSSYMSWEGDDFLKTFKNKVLPNIKGGQIVKVAGMLSEDAQIRRALEDKLKDEIIAKGAIPGKVQILSSYKSGYSWIEEDVLPALKTIDGCHSVKIRFSYLMNARGDDTFEDESMPNYGKHMDDPEKFFDIPTRWLQELFPVDELIERELCLNRDNVHFQRDDNMGHVYCLEAMDEEGHVLYRDCFDPKYVEKPYIKKYPQIGVTHVTTGWLEAEIDGKKAASERIETDIEKVWQFMEDELIPELERRLVRKYGIDGLVEAQPLFNKLQINIKMSETDRDLGFRQERISTAEALQEDIYFYLLDWFKTFGERECGRELDNVGLIMPEPEICTGQKTEIEVIMYDDLAEGSLLETCNVSFPIDAADDVGLSIKSIAFDGDVSILDVFAKGRGVIERAKVLSDMIEKGVIDMFSEENIVIRLSDEKHVENIHIAKRAKMQSQLSQKEKDRILENDVIDYDQYMQLLGYYDKNQALRIFPVETTYKGRKIYAVECIKREANVFYSASKVRNERITALFTARHHGNEASSMNSTFMLIDRLLSDMEYVLDKINVILVPFINIDGGMLHCDVHSRHPKWLCHPARYNSAGFEFRKDFNNPNSKYGEARVLRKIWSKYLFDVITDNHGFEGHELVQPFSGYISPWYKSFWVPRAFYYGYIWFSGSSEHMVKIGNLIRERVSEAINADEDIYELNKEFAERFEKYAQKWFPDLFKIDKFNEVVFYWTDTDKHPRPANYGVSNPEITAVDWTTEVADETAVGEYMELNARAHHISDVAFIKLLMEYEPITDIAHVAANEASDDGYCSGKYVKYRRHPLFSGDEKDL